MNAQDSMTTSVVGVATDSRIRHAPSRRNLSAGVRSAGRARKDAKSSIRHAMLAVIFLVAGTSSAAFGDETSAGVTVLRGTPARVEQLREPQRVQVMPPPLPSCPDGYAYSPFLGNCYRPRDPLNPVP
jgi:hypothetical protein